MNKEKNTSLFTQVDCIRVPVDNLEEGLKVYRDKLGHKLIWRTEDSAGLKMGSDSTELVLYTEKNGLEIDFKVNSVEEALDKFVKAGGRVLTEPFEIKVGKCAEVKDPWNNRYILLDLSKGVLKTDLERNVIENVKDGEKPNKK
ncbi:MAG: bleomycin resistance protein [Candidatus Korarchaeota archaeon]|nr:bleomycin resistance protein [Candidatus Korarchaeota archaeon]NIU84938.1 bleomycin resistance protein [Candidatus Thorarchaeota archaeon]NIW14955.1 bleomycin resistance protein [Candidatus Thorarchaeota archaeon]NIW52922.1 bleomycin resistance protein [Candidatus Korarchaeota archaeon]